MEVDLRAASTATGRPIRLLAAVAIIAVSACTVAGPPGAGTPAGGATAAGQTPGSDQASDAGSATKPDPCSLLTPDELKTQLDVDFQPGVLDPRSEEHTSELHHGLLSRMPSSA